MDYDNAFLQALLSNPTDTTTLLAYADWLDHQEDPRAEYVRLEVQHRQVVARMQEMQRQHPHPKWLAAVGGGKLAYNSIDHLECDLCLRGGRTIKLMRLDQVWTYPLFGGKTPHRESNNLLIEQGLEEAAKLGPAAGRPHLIEPSRRDRAHLIEPARPAKGNRLSRMVPHRRTKPEWLPIVRCIGVFESIGPTRNPQASLSTLTVVWFQDGSAMPVQEPALGQLLALDWDALAVPIFPWVNASGNSPNRPRTTGPCGTGPA